MRVTTSSLALASALASNALATVTPGSVFGDAYIVKDGAGASAKFYSVLDVYIKTTTTKDVISSIFGTSAGYVASFTQNQGVAFVQTNGLAASSWLPTNDDGRAWDSYVTNGARVQGSDTTLAGGKAGFLAMQLDTNWGISSSGSQIVGVTGSGGPGWFPGVGASTSSNPYCRSGYNGGTSSTAGYWNTAKTSWNVGNAGIDGQIGSNGIVQGQSLSNHWMIGRFVIEVTGLAASDERTMTLIFAVAGRNFATEASTTSTTFTGATSTAGRFNSTLTFAVPAPGAAALFGAVGLMRGRRRAH